MRNSLKFLLLGFFLTEILFLNIGFTSADPACYIDTEFNCNSNEHTILMRISGNTNAHGALQSQSNFPSNLVVCCQEIGEGDYDCTEDNKIIGLSSAGNAHAERPEYDNYGTHACYEFFSEIISAYNNPGGDYIPIVSLSSNENAHIGSSSAYSLVVYGEVTEGAGLECSLQDAYWEKDGQRMNETNNYVSSGTSVELVIEGIGCDEETIDFVIKEETTQEIPSGGEIEGETFLEGRADATWISQYMDVPNGPPKYFFTGEVPGITPIESGLLTVYNDDNTDPIVNVCDDYTTYFGINNPENEEICLADPYEVAPNSVTVNCDDPDITCFCTWDNDECKGAWEIEGEGGGICIYGEQKIINECEEDPVGTMIFNWTATWTGDPENRPPECKSDSRAIECPAQIPLPFFNAYNFIAVLLLIAAVYFVLNFRKKKKGK